VAKNFDDAFTVLTKYRNAMDSKTVS